MLLIIFFGWTTTQHFCFALTHCGTGYPFITCLYVTFSQMYAGNKFVKIFHIVQQVNLFSIFKVLNSTKTSSGLFARATEVL